MLGLWAVLGFGGLGLELYSPEHVGKIFLANMFRARGLLGIRA